MSIKYLIIFLKENFYFLNNILIQSKNKKLRKLQIPKNIVFKFITKLEPELQKLKKWPLRFPKLQGIVPYQEYK